MSVRWLSASLVAAVALMAAMWRLSVVQKNSLATVLPKPADSAVVVLGKRIFFDSSLSASGRMSCGTCHSPSHAYGPPNDLAVQLGGSRLNLQGMRAVPSLRYVLNRTPLWNKVFIANPAERIREGDEPPAGGFGADGRFNSLHDQAAFPLLAANEMANASPAEVVSKLQHGAYASDFQRVFGLRVFADTLQAYARALYAIERFELVDPSFRPYDSKFDSYLDGKIELTTPEMRGLSLFKDPRRGNCASCHIADKGADGSHPLFTDYQFGALGVPRNPEIRANGDRAYVDAGLCGPARRDQADHAEYCGMFKTPTLRNVATRGVFFHNGRFHSLKDALRFYVRRDTDPGHWYPRTANGGVDKFDDLPPSQRGNVDVIRLPFTRHRGDRPVWSDADIDDVVAFLKTLNDGFAVPAKP
ncbi:MAG TPA: cytochrome c peroxidase [Gemmatimonadaceae bacterium]|nr:cytochrome c peroxidase [Gemmatimonadaceae bacterium]